ncbi:1258_t:CDS:2, partial [Ambispora leptoticha]
GRDIPASKAFDYISGTPEGVGPVNPGQIIMAGLNVNGKNLSKIKFPTVVRTGLFIANNL